MLPLYFSFFKRLICLGELTFLIVMQFISLVKKTNTNRVDLASCSNSSLKLRFSSRSIKQNTRIMSKMGRNIFMNKITRILALDSWFGSKTTISPRTKQHFSFPLHHLIFSLHDLSTNTKTHDRKTYPTTNNRDCSYYTSVGYNNTVAWSHLPLTFQSIQPESSQNFPNWIWYTQYDTSHSPNLPNTWGDQVTDSTHFEP